jgi:Holliday junction DNA helicase RuvA
MIAHLRGKLAGRTGDHVVVDVGGVGYALTVPGSTAARLPGLGEDVFLHTHLAVRQDGVVLFGFTTHEELLMFLHLTSISGIGPRNALAVLSQYNPSAFYTHVLNEDVDALVLVPGVGQKTAQRIILELRDRIGVGKKKGGRTKMEAQRTPSSVEEEAVQALMALGYMRAEANVAVDEAIGAAALKASGEAADSAPGTAAGKVPGGAGDRPLASILTVEEIITRALKSMARV